jgi:hypothetical protein
LDFIFNLSSSYRNLRKKRKPAVAALFIYTMANEFAESKLSNAAGVAASNFVCTANSIRTGIRR